MDIKQLVKKDDNGSEQSNKSLEQAPSMNVNIATDSTETTQNNNETNEPISLEQTHEENNGDLDVGSSHSNVDGTQIEQEKSVKLEAKVTEDDNNNNGPDLKNINISETIGGTSTRKYINRYVTPFLLAGMKKIAVEKPEDPLRVLGEYLIEQSEKNERIRNHENK
ncbi:Sdc1p NDAI_0H01000 [Naumovozyma dairenensis CBS 421]|uniref:Uncharacterized protein n=1 Tax=Naumovozyma dairenensis (strain ATCC 10597 / BCRC 20456 / CBS 421 / NBRC 0211 / NRRL Y-12639) TaxID=1071378 RepID=G0WER3_NAUDC|nr:hypothetical protein NDAI_0H01000 [Naumovozyma dairenensis CBS 421]CCD26274.1 hypothetical protein NDAI_0H01000 [Naumovozyma dairenensis CBS 421]